MPAGMEEPKVTAVSSVLAKAATRRRSTIDVALEELHDGRFYLWYALSKWEHAATHSQRPYGSGSLQSRKRLTTSSADGIRMKTMR